MMNQKQIAEAIQSIGESLQKECHEQVENTIKKLNETGKHITVADATFAWMFDKFAKIQLELDILKYHISQINPSYE